MLSTKQAIQLEDRKREVANRISINPRGQTLDSYDGRMARPDDRVVITVAGRGGVKNGYSTFLRTSYVAKENLEDWFRQNFPGDTGLRRETRREILKWAAVMIVPSLTKYDI